MARTHLFEIAEQSWCPFAIRSGVTDFLSFSEVLGRYFDPVADRIGDLLLRLDCHSIVDLASGSGGPSIELNRQLNARLSNRIQSTLTDLFPNEDLAAILGNDPDLHVHYCTEPVDARQVPTSLQGFRTMFASFHHFRPGDAQIILRDAVENGAGICVAEFTTRDAVNLLLLCLGPIYVFILTPFIRPFRWSRLLFTYLLPIIPFIILFDGVISWLRTYSKEELSAIVQSLEASNVTWDIGQYRVPGIFFKVTYITGIPAQPDATA